MELPSDLKYSLLALMELASHPTGAPLRIRDIAAKYIFSEPYLEFIFVELSQKGIVKSTQEGYVLAREAGQITVLEIVSVVESKTQRPRRETTIDEDSIDKILQQADQAARSTLEQYTLQDLCQRRDL